MLCGFVFSIEVVSGFSELTFSVVFVTSVVLCEVVVSVEFGSGFSELIFSLFFVGSVVFFGKVAVVVERVSLEKLAIYSEGTLATKSLLLF